VACFVRVFSVFLPCFFSFCSVFCFVSFCFRVFHTPWPLLGGQHSMHTRMLLVLCVDRVPRLTVVCCLLSVVWLSGCLLSGCLVVCCLLAVVLLCCCAVVCCLLSVVCCLVVWLSGCLLSGCLLSVVLVPVVCCLKGVEPTASYKMPWKQRWYLS
jgi:hypothetical protein